MNSRSNTFNQQLQSAWASQGSMLCVGFDPDPKRMPASTGGKPLGIFEFCRDIADATADVVCGNIQQVDLAASALLAGAHAVSSAAEQLRRGSRPLVRVCLASPWLAPAATTINTIRSV